MTSGRNNSSGEIIMDLSLIINIAFFVLSLFFGILSFVFRGTVSRHEKEMEDTKNELKKMIEERENRNYESHKEIWQKQNDLRDKVTKLETVQGLCKTCQGE
jgi:uncharacterized protein YoxC